MSQASERLRLLFVGDGAGELRPLVEALVHAGFEVEARHASAVDELVARLEAERPDLSIVDAESPRLAAEDALAELRRRAPETPVLVVSGPMGETRAVALMRAGAADCLDRSQPARLVPAVRRELRAVEERRDAEAARRQLIHADRLAAIGQLAAGMGHEINNPLASLIANQDAASDLVRGLERFFAELAARVDPELSSLMREHGVHEAMLELASIGTDLDAGLQRVRSLVSDMRAFSRIDREEVLWVDANEPLRTAISLTRNELRPKAELSLELAELPPLPAHPGRLAQVWINLLLNAAQALDGGPRRGRVTVRSEQRDGHVVVSIGDDGPGIADDVRPRIFEPFFTTKARSVGSGLGLTLCADTVRQHQGRIEVDSAPGAGTTIRVWLPLDNGLRPAAARPVARPATPAARSRVLIIDDDPLLLSAFRRILARHHEVEAVDDGAEGLRRLLNEPAYDVVVCDLMMPTVDGPEIYARLASDAPDVAERVIFCTGGAFTRRAREFSESVNNTFLQKPVARDDLLAAIRRVVERGSSHAG
jgi:signal transduction histidine kinase